MKSLINWKIKVKTSTKWSGLFGHWLRVLKLKKLKRRKRDWLRLDFLVRNRMWCMMTRIIKGAAVMRRRRSLNRNSLFFLRIMIGLRLVLSRGPQLISRGEWVRIMLLRAFLWMVLILCLSRRMKQTNKWMKKKQKCWKKSSQNSL